jgi:hypothetical protein
MSQHHSNPGGATKPPVTSAIRTAKSIAAASSNFGPRIWTPTGNPCGVCPTRRGSSPLITLATESPARAVTLKKVELGTLDFAPAGELPSQRGVSRLRLLFQLDSCFRYLLTVLRTDDRMNCSGSKLVTFENGIFCQEEHHCRCSLLHKIAYIS